MISCKSTLCKVGSSEVNQRTDVCRICHSSNITRFRHLNSNYARCHECGSYTKILTEEEYRDLNPTYDPGALSEERRVEVLRRILRVDECKAFLRPIVSKLRSQSGIRALDIGCGQGANLLAARELGCEVVGVEPSRLHSRTARDLFGLTVENGYFSADRFAPRQFDLVILSHVIEHILNPRAFIVDILKVLAPGGMLVIVTPSAGSSTLWFVGRHWTMFKPIDHVSMLTETAFRKMDLPPNVTLEFSQTEHSWQPVVELLQSMRDALRGLLKSEDEVVVFNAQKPASHALSRFDRWRRILWVFSLLSLPLHLFNKAAATQACLVVRMKKASEHDLTGELA